MSLGPDVTAKHSKSWYEPIATNSHFLTTICMVLGSVFAGWLCLVLAKRIVGNDDLPSSRRVKKKKKDSPANCNAKLPNTEANLKKKAASTTHQLSSSTAATIVEEGALLPPAVYFSTQFDPNAVDTMLLMRHGERVDHVDKNWMASSNGGGNHCVSTDPFLSSNGRREALEFALAMMEKRRSSSKRQQADSRITYIITSPMLRCVETSMIIAIVLDIPVFVDPLLADWHGAKLYRERRPMLGSKFVKKQSKGTSADDSQSKWFLEAHDANVARLFEFLKDADAEYNGHDEDEPDEGIDGEEQQQVASILLSGRRTMENRAEADAEIMARLKHILVWSSEATSNVELEDMMSVGTNNVGLGYPIPYPESAAQLQTRLLKSAEDRFVAGSLMQRSGPLPTSEVVKRMFPQPSKAMRSALIGECANSSVLEAGEKRVALPPSRVLCVTHADCVHQGVNALCPRYVQPGASGGIKVPYASITTLELLKEDGVRKTIAQKGSDKKKKHGDGGGGDRSKKTNAQHLSGDAAGRTWQVKAFGAVEHLTNPMKLIFS